MFRQKMKTFILIFFLLDALVQKPVDNLVCKIDIPKQIVHNLKVSGFHKNQDYRSKFQKNWMKQLGDETPVYKLSIPGTHDTGTFRCNYQKPCHIFQCQTLSIYEQLTSGIRYLDLRINSEFPLTVGHQQIEFMYFDEVLKDVKKFLEENKDEFVILAFQRNTGDFDASFLIESSLQHHQIEVVYEVNPLKLTVGDLRGKAWIFSGLGITFSTETFLLEGVSGITNNQHLYLQNFWEIYPQTVSNKTDHALKTAFDVECFKMKGNFLSGSVGITPFELTEHSGGPNAKLLEILKKKEKRCLGITIMDFPKVELIEAIIMSNSFKEQNK